MMKKKFLICILIVFVSLVCESAFAAVNVSKLHKLAGKGDAKAQYELGLCYLNGEGVKQSYQIAFDWYRKAAEQGYAEAQFELGELYYQGKGVIQDRSKSFLWWSKAAEQNHAGALYNLGAIYETGQGVQQNLQEAVKYYKLAAAQGYPGASEEAERLEVSYKRNGKIAQDKKSQVQHLDNWGYSNIDSMIQAAQKGNLSAQYRLGDAYFRGNGIKQDYQQAKYWYEKAAEQNLVEAQYTLGMMYSQGMGVAKDYVQAEYWFRKAAENGDKNASAHLKSITAQAQSQKQAEAKKAEQDRIKAEKEEAARQKALAQQKREQGTRSIEAARKSVWYKDFPPNVGYRSVGQQLDRVFSNTSWALGTYPTTGNTYVFFEGIGRYRGRRAKYRVEFNNFGSDEQWHISKIYVNDDIIYDNFYELLAAATDPFGRTTNSNSAVLSDFLDMIYQGE